MPAAGTSCHTHNISGRRDQTCSANGRGSKPLAEMCNMAHTALHAAGPLTAPKLAQGSSALNLPCRARGGLRNPQQCTTDDLSCAKPTSFMIFSFRTSFLGTQNMRLDIAAAKGLVIAMDACSRDALMRCRQQQATAGAGSSCSNSCKLTGQPACCQTGQG